jgi:cytochrome c553
MPLTVLPLLLAATAASPPARLGLCESCHGRDGRARAPQTPHLGGQDEAYLREALHQYRDGRRDAQVMNGIAAMLAPADVDALARWYASQSWPAVDDEER